MVSHLADYIAANPQALVAICTNTTAERDVIIHMMRKKMRCQEIARLHFVNPKTTFVGRKYDAVYADNIDHALEVSTLARLTRPEIMVVTKELKDNAE